MLPENTQVNTRRRLWAIALSLCILLLALIWSDVGVGESLQPTQTLDSSSGMVWRQCNPNVTPDIAYRWDIPTPTPTPRIRICDCILKQVATPTPTGTPRVFDK